MLRSMLHGRAQERAVVDRMLAAARPGSSDALVLRGEAGVGKSALLDRAAAAEGMTLLRAAGIESESEFPFAAVHQVLRPELTGLIDAIPARQADALRAAFGAAPSGGGDRFLVSLAVLSGARRGRGGAAGAVFDRRRSLARRRVRRRAPRSSARRLDADGVAMIFAARDGGEFAAPGLPDLTGDRPRSGRSGRGAAGARRVGGGPSGRGARRASCASTAGNPLALLELPVRAHEGPAQRPRCRCRSGFR